MIASSARTAPIAVRAVIVLGLLIAGPTWACAETGTGNLGASLPLWSIAPFAALLLAIAVLPLTARHWWESNRNKAVVSLILGAPVGIWMGVLDVHVVAEVGGEFFSFIVLLGALYIISGGIYVRGAPSGTPLINTATLAIGSLLASVIGTTGASMVMIRPFLRANAHRTHRTHLVVFFILLVANIGGSLTPLGDPPLYLGFLRGVPFFWTLNLWGPWALGVGSLLIVFHFVDDYWFERDDLATPGSLVEEVHQRAPMRIEGKVNILYLGGVIAAAFSSGVWHWPFGVREAVMAALTLASLRTTPAALRKENEFTYHPIVEVAVLFAGIFLSMIPALAILNARGAALGIERPWEFFWATGILSGFLDNAPTYLTFLSLAQGLDLPAEVAGVPHAVLAAISVGAVFMGANSYIGNGPNFMVKSIAEAAGVRMPSFFGYLVRVQLVLLPLYAVLTWLFFS